MKSIPKIIAASLPLSSLPAFSAVFLVAGWDDNFSGSNGWAANYLDAQTSASVAASTTVGSKSWSQWNFTDQGASNDGTFGDLGVGVAAAVTTFTGSANSTLTGGGQELLVDNIGITADLIPEPSVLALVGLSGLALLIRRRRF